MKTRHLWSHLFPMFYNIPGKSYLIVGFFLSPLIVFRPSLCCVCWISKRICNRYYHEKSPTYAAYLLDGILFIRSHVCNCAITGCDIIFWIRAAMCHSVQSWDYLEDGSQQFFVTMRGVSDKFLVRKHALPVKYCSTRFAITSHWNGPSFLTI